RAVFLLQEGTTFTNKSDGRIVSRIAGTSSIGQFQMAAPCCNGAGVVNAGGSLLPTLVGGYIPTANAEFPLFLLVGGKITGTFSHLGNRFTADYTHESTSPAFVGAVYRSTKK
ncbi:MAG TPA: hypothetical protein VNL71_09285, partial [Chloroflexota bacterium]|nr:hypothetical protein [Chloroflexota bacterium]